MLFFLDMLPSSKILFKLAQRSSWIIFRQDYLAKVAIRGSEPQNLARDNNIVNFQNHTMKKILFPFYILSAGGLILSAFVHLASLLGFNLFGDIAWGLHAGIFVVWFPAVIVSMFTVGKRVMVKPLKDMMSFNFQNSPFFTGCPKWMVNLTNGLFIYGIINFIIFIMHQTSAGGSGGNSPQVFRGFSGHWMIFYSAAMSIFYSAIHKPTEEVNVSTCSNGHTIEGDILYCPQCGERILKNINNTES